MYEFYYKKGVFSSISFLYFRTGQILNCAFDRTPEQVFYEALKMAESEWEAEIASYTSTESMQLDDITGKNSNSIC